MTSETDCKTLTHTQENNVHGTGVIQKRKEDENCSTELSEPTYGLAQHSKGRTYGILGYNLQ